MNREDLASHAFWEHGVCLCCETSNEEWPAERAAAVCEDCDQGVVVPARKLFAFIERLDEETAEAAAF